MLIVADENIPLAAEIFGGIGQVRTVPGHELRRQQLESAEVLLVRSVTRVDEKLLAGSRIRLVGSATIGTDHIDRDYLAEAGIAFAHAPGSNADSVADYVIAALLRLCVRRRRSLRGLKAGIVGCGEIGARVARRFAALGIAILPNDPPLAAEMEQQGRDHRFMPLGEVVSEADVLTVHVPLQSGGPHPTVHLIGADALSRMKEGAWLINTSRGPVVDNTALKRSRRDLGRPGAVVLDVWEDEPSPDAELLQTTDIATPHIAGYAADAKLRGTWMLYQSLRRFLGMRDPGEMPPEIAGMPGAIRLMPPDPRLAAEEWLDMLVRQMYDVGRDDEALRRLAEKGQVDGRHFAALRRDYPVRREFSVYVISRSAVPAERQASVGDGLNVRLHSGGEGIPRGDR